MPGIEVKLFSDHSVSLQRSSSLCVQVHRAALAAHAQAEGRLEEQERREQGLKEEVPGIQVKFSLILKQTIMTRAINRRIVLPWLLMPKQRGDWRRWSQKKTKSAVQSQSKSQ